MPGAFERSRRLHSLTEIERIARACHQANKAICESFGDQSQHDWDCAPQWQRDSAVTGVRFCIANPDAPPSANHDSWLAEKVAAGWSYGPEKDVATKRHPCMVPFDQLPPEQKVKDHVFKAIVASLA